MFQFEAGAHVLLYSFSHCQHPSLLSRWRIREFNPCCSLRLVPMCFFTAVNGRVG